MINFIVPYYDSPSLLEGQIKEWHKSLSKGLSVRFMVVDDGSPNHPAENVLRGLPEGLELIEAEKVVVFRIKQNIPWNQHGARNLGASKSVDKWMIMVDVDHILPVDQLESLCKRVESLDHKRLHFFNRFKSEKDGSLTKKNYHCNSFLIHHNLYWEAKGYDEDYCGSYGGDGQFRKNVAKVARGENFLDEYLVYTPRSRIEDVGHNEWGRTGEFKELYRARLRAKNKTGATWPTSWLRFDWERVI